MTSYTLSPTKHSQFITLELLKGRHIDIVDGELFKELSDCFATYDAIFERLGFSLIAADNYFYLEGERDLQKFPRQLAVTILVLEQFFAESSSHRSLFASGGHRLESLQLFQRRSWTEKLNAEDIHSFEDLRLVFKQAAKLGFVTFEDDVVTFRSSISRFRKASLKRLQIAQNESQIKLGSE